MNKQIKKINTRTITLTILFILILIVIALLIGKFTYSYLAPTIDDDVEGIGEVTASGDTIIFTKGNKLSINATTDNFKTNGNNLTSTTNPKVKLMASSKTNTATAKYFAGIIINNNSYKYTTTDKKPEVILTIKDETGNIVTTSSDDLKFVTVDSNLQGFDITGEVGAFNIVTDHVIATPTNKTEVIHTWTFTITFVNLSTDQSENENAKLDMEVTLQKEKIPTSVADFVDEDKSLNEAIISAYNGLGQTLGLYHHDANLTNGAEDNSYRFAGGNPKNYVCFGSDEENCPYENLYRIIGLIDGKVKLISADGATTDMLGKDGGYYSTYKSKWGTSLDSYYKKNGDLTKIGIYEWNKNNTNTWSTSTTYTTNLNTNYLSYLDGKDARWRSLIDDTTWYVGGMTNRNGVWSDIKTTYNYEVGANKDANTTVTSKIGLMYVSDYYYGALPEYWTLYGGGHTGNDYKNAINDNWMYIGLFEWTISRISDRSYQSHMIRCEGVSEAHSVDDTNAMRPTFNLISSVKYVSGSGIESDPIRLTD